MGDLLLPLRFFGLDWNLLSDWSGFFGFPSLCLGFAQFHLCICYVMLFFGALVGEVELFWSNSGLFYCCPGILIESLVLLIFVSSCSFCEGHRGSEVGMWAMSWSSLY